MTSITRAAAAPQSGSRTDLEAGVMTLLRDAAGVTEGTDLLLINATDGSVEPEMIEAIERGGRALGARIHSLWTDKIATVEDVPPVVKCAFETADVTIFNHRLSSMLRLMPISGGRLVSNFFTTRTGLASECARMPMAYWRELLRRAQDRINEAQSWRITCDDGTNLTGRTPPRSAPAKASDGQTFSTVSFPIGIFKPLPMDTANGTLMLRWLGISGVHFIPPESLSLDRPVVAKVEHGRITDLQGDAGCVEKLKSFVGAAAERYGKDPWLLNGWHAGINAAVRPNHDLSEGVERWLFNGHQSPRVVHFHMVGTEPPGEYSAACLDPTITFDDEVMWRDGRFVFAAKEEIRRTLERYGDPAIAAGWRSDIGV